MAATIDIDAERVIARREREQTQTMLAQAPDKVAEALEWLKRTLAETERPAMSREDFRAHCGTLLEQLVSEYTPAEREQAADEMAALRYGWGKLDPLMTDSTVTEVAVDSPREVCYWQAGRLLPADGRDGRPQVAFRDDDEVRRWVEAKTQFLGRHFDRANPILNVMLDDGTRLQATREPVSPCVTLNLRKPPAATRRWTPEDYAATGAASMELLDFMRTAVQGGVRLLVLGATGTGKTAFVRLLQEHYLPAHLRLLILEAEREQEPERPRTVSLQEVRHGARRGRDEAAAIDMNDLADTAGRKTPDAYTVGEVLGVGEAAAFFRAISTGHSWCFTTMHADGPEDAMDLLTAYTSGGIWKSLPQDRVERLVHRSLDLMVFLRKLPAPDNPEEYRIVVTQVFEVMPLTEGGDPYRLIWQYNPRLGGHVYVRHVSPWRLDRWEQRGARIPEEFGRNEMAAHRAAEDQRLEAMLSELACGGERGGGRVAAAGARKGASPKEGGGAAGRKTAKR
jgi:pilus assembly protein CpaF